MLPRADLAVSPASRPDAVAGPAALGDGRQELFQRSLAGLVGQSLQAEVLSKLTDGSFLVKIGDTAARLPLPPGVQVGGKVDLTLVALTPRPTFQINADAGGKTALAYAEAAPAGARAEPLVYLDVAHAAAAALQSGQGAAAGTRAGADARAPGAGGAAAGAGGAAAAGAVAGDAHAGAGAPLAGGAGPGAARPAAGAPANGAALAAGATAAALAAAPASPAAATAAAAAAETPAAAAAPAGHGADTAAPAHAASPGAILLGKAPLVPADQLPAIDPKSTPASLSPAARMISSVLGSAADGGARAIIGNAPLADSPQAPPEKLAAALKDAIGNSGLFYESHVAEWAAGQRPLAALAQEPQMRAAPEARTAGAPDPAAAQFINLQLASAEQGRVAWQGLAWPGQAMQWEISRDAPERGRSEPGDAPEAAWRSGLRLQFPLLGDVRASIVMVGNALHIDVAAADGGAGEALRARAAGLTDALAAAGLPLSSLRIRDADG